MSDDHRKKHPEKGALLKKLFQFFLKQNKVNVRDAVKNAEDYVRLAVAELCVKSARRRVYGVGVNVQHRAVP